MKDAETLLVQGLYTYKNLRVREEFSNTILAICQQLTKNSTKPPLNFELDLLINNLPKEDQYYATRECKQFFELFIKVLDLYFEKGTVEGFDMFGLMRAIIERLKNHKSTEKKSSILEDMALIGYINLVERIIWHLAKVDRKRTVQILEETDLVHEVFYECLFYHP